MFVNLAIDEKRADAERLAEKLRVHAETEEQGLDPAAPRRGGADTA